MPWLAGAIHRGISRDPEGVAKIEAERWSVANVVARSVFRARFDVHRKVVDLALTAILILPAWERIAAVIAAVLLVAYFPWSNEIGYALAALLVINHLRRAHAATAPATP